MRYWFALFSVLLLGVSLGFAQTLPDFSHPDDPHVMAKNPFAFPSQLDQFEYLKYRIGVQPLMVILLEFPDSAHGEIYTPEYFENHLFGPHPSVNGYFDEVSYGKFSFSNAGVVGWYTAPQTSDYYFTGAHYTELAAAAVEAAVAGGVEFESYDANDDGEVTRDELLIQMVFAPHPPWGQPWLMATRPVQTESEGVITPGGLEIDTWAIRGTESGSISLFSHELAHLALALPDLYGDDFGGDPSGYYTLMAVIPSYTPHFSPWAKIHLGWIEPVVVPVSGFYTLAAVEQDPPEAYIMYSPEHGVDEYFIIENRWPEASLYESALPDRGLAVWHITEFYDDEPFNFLRGRKMVAMKWAGGPGAPLTALWDCSEPVTCYDLTDTSSPRNSRWEDGSSSGLEMTDYSEAGELMQAYFSVCFNDTESCDAMDNDCNGLIDDGIVPPSGPIVLTTDDATLSWTADPLATGYDSVRGGNPSNPGEAVCLADNHPSTSLAASDDPALGQLFWFLVRPVNCGGAGSYGSRSRDAEVNSCP